MSEKILFETYGSSQQYFYDFKEDKGRYEQQCENKKKIGKGIANRFKESFKSGFLPQGYPESVSEDYLQYQIWDTIQAFSSSLTGMLATQAVLKGYGVGDETASVTAASITWMLKDGAGMIGRILFAWWKGLCADVLNDTAIFLDLLAPVFKSYFIFIACISSITRAIVGVAGGATRAALTLHQARRNNMADVSAKDGSQETLVGLLALVAGFIITPVVAEKPILVWSFFVFFTFLHLYANYQGVSCVIMETININRLYILLKHYLHNNKILVPKQVCRLDPVVMYPGYRKYVNVGVKLEKVLENYENPKTLLEKVMNQKHNFVLGYDKKNINLSFQKDCNNMNILEACIQALLLDLILNNTDDEMRKNGKHSQELSNLSETFLELHQGKNDIETITKLQDFSKNFCSSFMKGLEENNWDLSKCHLNPDEWRYDWHKKME